MAECVVLSIDEGVCIGMEGGVVRCGSCGLERQWNVSDCKLCEVLARNAALEEEVKEVKVLLAETRQQMQELRWEVSIRSGTGEGKMEGCRYGREREGELCLV